MKEPIGVSYGTLAEDGAAKESVTHPLYANTLTDALKPVVRYFEFLQKIV